MSIRPMTPGRASRGIADADVDDTGILAAGAYSSYKDTRDSPRERNP